MAVFMGDVLILELIAKVKNNKKTIFIIKIVFTLLLSAYIMSLISFDDIGRYLTRINYFYVLILALLFFVFVLLGALNTYFIILSIKKVPLLKILNIFCISMSLGMYTPAYIGEIGATTYLLHQEGFTVSQGLSVSSIDKFLTLTINSILFLIGLWFYMPEMPFFIYLFTVLVITIPLLCIFLRPLRKLIKRKIIERFFPWAVEYFNAVISFFLNHKPLFILNLSGTLLRAFIGAFMIWIGLAALGVRTEICPVIFTNFVARMVSYLPVTISGLGLLEGAAIALFKELGIQPEATLIAFLLDRTVCTLFSIVVILIYIWNRRFYSVNQNQSFDIL